MTTDTLAEKISDILGEVENRLLTDTRMPGRADGHVAITPIETVRRSRRFEDRLDKYPTAFIVEGELEENDLTTRSNEFFLMFAVQVFSRDSHPEQGTIDIREYTLAVRRVLRETITDKMMISGGVALVEHIEVRGASWDAFQPLADEGDIEFAGQVEFRVRFSLPC